MEKETQIFVSLHFNKMEILYEDNHIIIVNKSPREIVQGDKTGDKPLVDMVKDYLKEKYHKPGNVFVELFIGLTDLQAG